MNYIVTPAPNVRYPKASAYEEDIVIYISSGRYSLIPPKEYRIRIESGDTITETTIPTKSGITGEEVFTVLASEISRKKTYIHFDIETVDAFGNISPVNSFEIALVDCIVKSPRITQPSNGESEIPPITTIKISEFEIICPFEEDTPRYTQLQISKDEDFSEMVYDTGETGMYLTSIDVPIELDKGETFYLRARHFGNRLRFSEWSETSTFSTIKEDTVVVAFPSAGASGRSMTRLNIDGEISPNPNFTTHPVYSKIREFVIDGQIMVKIPKFYYKRSLVSQGPLVGKKSIEISDKELPGYRIHPAFLVADEYKVMDHFFVGGYQGGRCLEEKLLSLPNYEPYNGLSITEMRTYCNNYNSNGTEGFHVWNIHEVSAIQMLMLAEYGNTDLRSILGVGNVDSKMTSSVSDESLLDISWRGITGLWSNGWQFVDGVKFIDGVMYIYNGSTYIPTKEVFSTSGYGIPSYVTDFSTYNEDSIWTDALFISMNEVELETYFEDNGIHPDSQQVASDMGTGEFHYAIGGDGLFSSIKFSQDKNSIPEFITRLAKY